MNKNFTKANLSLMLDAMSLEVLRDSLKDAMNKMNGDVDLLINFINEVADRCYNYHFERDDDKRIARAFKYYKEICAEEFFVDLVDSTYQLAMSHGLWCNTKFSKSYQAEKLDNPYDVYNYIRHDHYEGHDIRMQFFHNRSVFSCMRLRKQAFVGFSILVHIIYDNIFSITSDQIFSLLDHIVLEYQKKGKQALSKED